MKFCIRIVNENMAGGGGGGGGGGQQHQWSCHMGAIFHLNPILLLCLDYISVLSLFCFILFTKHGWEMTDFFYIGEEIYNLWCNLWFHHYCCCSQLDLPIIGPRLKSHFQLPLTFLLWSYQNKFTHARY